MRTITTENVRKTNDHNRLSARETDCSFLNIVFYTLGWMVLVLHIYIYDLNSRVFTYVRILCRTRYANYYKRSINDNVCII